MFNTTLKTLALSAVIGLGAFTVVPASAQSNGLYLGFGGGHDSPRVGVWLGENGHSDRRDYRRDDRRHGGRECTPSRAVDKAESMGLRRARVVDTSRNSITVAGRVRGDREFITFARAPRCPVIG